MRHTALGIRHTSLAVVLLVAMACASAPQTLSPAGTAAFHATRVVKALDVLRDFAIDCEAQNPKLLSTDNTRKVINFHESALKTIAAVPGGWKPTVTAGLTQLQQDLPAAESARLKPYIDLVKAVIEVMP